jgi:hypothetical protein
MTDRTVSVVVTALLPSGVSLSEWADYVEAEVKAGLGAKHPRDPLTNLRPSTISVRRVRSKAVTILTLM